MDITQTKLTKLEWESIELPVSESEKEILQLIKSGFLDTNIRYNTTNSLFDVLKIDRSDYVDHYLFHQYIATILSDANNIIQLELPVFNQKKFVIKKITQMKLQNSESTLGPKKKDIFEFIVAELINQFAKSLKRSDSKYVMYFYTIYKMNQLQIRNKNQILVDYCHAIFTKYESQISYMDILTNGCDTLERNTNLLKYGDMKLFDHQKRIFSIYNRKPPSEPTLTLYIAPTATGKL